MSYRFAILSLCLLAACETSPPSAPDPQLLAEQSGGPAIAVHPGQSIQAAIDAAAPGAVIRIEPGTYSEALTVDKPGLRIVGGGGAGKPGVIIQNPGGAENGIAVGEHSAGFVLENLTVQGFEENGVLLIGVNRFLLSRITAVSNGEYGLFPVLSSNGVIERCTATGHSDAGIYVGQSTDVEVRQSTAFGNVLGIEIENSTRVSVVNNESYDNVVGIMVVLLPGLTVKSSSGVLVARNRVHDNNRPNFAPPGEIESFVPTGSGILVVGPDRAVIQANQVSGNQFVGIGLASTLILGVLAGLPPEYFEDIEPNPDGVHVIDNSVIGNGGTPSVPFLPAVDLLWDGSGTDNCWRANQFGTAAPDPLPSCSSERL